MRKMMAVITSESGIAVRVMMVVRKFSRKRKRMMITRMKPSRSACSTLVIEFTIKFFCWNTSVWIFRSVGRVGCVSDIGAMISSVRMSVLVVG